MKINSQYKNMKSLEELFASLQGARVAVLGAGPTLDLSLDALPGFDWYFCADVLAPALHRELPIAHSLYFSVEHRRHSYLKGLRNHQIAFYERANEKNLSRFAKNSTYYFKLAGEIGQAPFTLVSPGTVGGVAAGFALYLLHSKIIESVTFFGMDMAYLDLRIYSRLVTLGSHDRLQSFENFELERVLKKTVEAESVRGEIIRRSAEMSLASEKLQQLIAQVDSEKVFSYSPVGPSGVILNPFKK